LIKMKEMWTAIKKRRFDKKTEKLQKQAIQYIKENEKLERHIAELQEGHQPENEQLTIRNDDTRRTEKIRNELLMAPTGGENSKNKKKSDTTLNDKVKLHLKKKRPRKRSTKRCHFCRKRGHMQRNCVIKKFVLNWLWGDVGVSEKVKDIPQKCRA